MKPILDRGVCLEYSMYSNAGVVKLTKACEPFLKYPPLPSPRKLARYKMILSKKDAISLKFNTAMYDTSTDSG